MDVSRYEPLQSVTCPGCSQPFVVQGQLDRFQLTGIAGQGGMGTVYKAFDPQLGRLVALKVVRADKAGDEEMLGQLEAEAQITASLNHPNVLRVFSVGRAQERFYIAMELVNGGSLEDFLNAHPILPEVQALDIAMQIASGLQAAQQAGLVHRDVKPGNVLFANSVAKVMDFGLAVFEEKSAGAQGAAWGSPFYMPPERLEGLAEDFRGDIYALGTVLYQMLTGRPAFDAATPEQVAYKRLTNPAPSVLTFAPRTSNATAFVVKKMLEKDREQRFQSYDELIDSLKFAREDLKQNKAARAAVAAKSKDDERKAGMWVTVTIAVFFVVAAVAGVMILRRSKSEEAASVTPPPPKDLVQTPMVNPARTLAPSPVPSPTTDPKPTPVATQSRVAEIPSAIGSGVYRIINLGNGENLHVQSASLERDAEVVTWPAPKALNSRWFVNKVAGGYQIVAFHSFKAFQIVPAASEQDSELRQRNFTDSSLPVWALEPAEKGAFRLGDEKHEYVTAVPIPAAGGTRRVLAKQKTAGDDFQLWKFELIDPMPNEIASILHGVKPSNTPAALDATVIGAPSSSRFVSIGMEAVANRDSRKPGMFRASETSVGMHIERSGWVSVGQVPFNIIDAAKCPSGNDELILKGNIDRAATYPSKVELPVNGARLSKIHFLGGVSGWGYTAEKAGVFGWITANVKVVRRGGGEETFQIRNGMESSDWPKRNDVPYSACVGGLVSNGQIRYFSKDLKGRDPVEKIVIESIGQKPAPIFVAITGEIAN